MFIKKLLPTLLATTLTLPTFADGVYFMPKLGDDIHSEWSLTCDNLNTCRADGYYDEEMWAVSDELVSVLFERQIGESLPKGLVALEFFEDKEVSKKSPVRMSVAGRDVGVIRPLDTHWQMSDVQVKAVLSAVAKTGKANITFRQGRHVWRLSDVGLKEVLAKMDSVQGTVGTTHGLLSRGSRAFLGKAPSSVPLIKTYPVYDEGGEYEVARNSAEGRRLAKLLTPTLAELDSCDVLEVDGTDEWDEELGFTITPLNYDYTLVRGRCFRGAYNIGDGAWVLDKSLKKIHQTVGLVTDKDDNELHFVIKGRGMGDCVDASSWVWAGVGDKFVQTQNYHTGQCKGFAGGAWYIPTLVTTQKQQDEWTITIVEEPFDE